MPTKKQRIGFIPRDTVLDLINKLSYESNLSYSKIINILVEEALHKRGMLNIKTDYYPTDNNKNNLKLGIGNISKEFNSNSTNNFLKEENRNINEVEYEPLNNEIYEKFIMFLQFQERMKKRQ